MWIRSLLPAVAFAPIKFFFQPLPAAPSEHLSYRNPSEIPRSWLAEALCKRSAAGFCSRLLRCTAVHGDHRLQDQDPLLWMTPPLKQRQTTIVLGRQGLHSPDCSFIVYSEIQIHLCSAVANCHHQGSSFFPSSCQHYSIILLKRGAVGSSSSPARCSESIQLNHKQLVQDNTKDKLEMSYSLQNSNWLPGRFN